jgi:16S rRNA methyltransferase RsmB/F
VFDRVLLDVPCSGSGVLAKRADLRWRREPSDLAEMTALQVAAGPCDATWTTAAAAGVIWPANTAMASGCILGCT